VISLCCGLNLLRLSAVALAVSSSSAAMCSRFVLYLLIQIVEIPSLWPTTHPPAALSPLSLGQHSTLPPDTFVTATKTFVLFSAEQKPATRKPSTARQGRQHCKNAKTKGWKKSICIRRITPQLVANVMTGSVTSGPGNQLNCWLTACREIWVHFSKRDTATERTGILDTVCNRKQGRDSQISGFSEVPLYLSIRRWSFDYFENM